MDEALYNELNNKLNEFITDNNLDEREISEIARMRAVDLVLGAGVTKCIVGNWNELLNEVAIIRCASLEDKIVREEIEAYRLFVDGCVAEGKFLSESLDPKEKGEYLRYDENDYPPRNFDFGDAIEERRKNIDDREHPEWREKAFAMRVKIAIERLKDRHLCDGSGSHKSESFIKDFLAWKNDNPVGFCSLTRASVTNNEMVEQCLGGMEVKAILKELNSYYRTIAFSESGYNELERAFSALLKAKPQKIPDCIRSIKEIAIEYFKIFVEAGCNLGKILDDAVNKIVLEGFPASKGVKEQVLLKLVSWALWRPDYSTIDAVLQLCFSGKVANIITYNFDLFFDGLLVEQDVARLYEKSEIPKVCLYGIHDPKPIELEKFNKTTEGEKTDCGKIRINIYHVHGLLCDEIREVFPIIFSETSYNEYKSAYLNRSIRLFAKVYDESKCLICVGFSGNDTNFRMIVNQMKKMEESPVFGEGRQRKIFLTKAWKEEADRYRFKHLESASSDQVQMAYGCTKTFLSMVNHYYRDALGVKIWWSHTYDQMAENLRKIC